MPKDNVFNLLERTGGGESKAAYIVDSSYGENSWYRVWSDGFIEQGGQQNCVGTDYVGITFPIPYTTKVNILACRTVQNGSNAVVSQIQQGSVMLTGFTAKADWWGTAGKGTWVVQFWRAEGY